MLRRLNDALPGLVAGILLYGILLQVTGIWLAKDKLGYTIGLWYGILIAVGLAVHMASMIYDSVYEDTGGKTNRRVVAKSMVRYVTVVALIALIGYFRFGSLIMAMLGVLGLKVSAYSYPLLARTGLLCFRTEDDQTDHLIRDASEESPATFEAGDDVAPTAVTDESAG